jgi:hypothetical protein
MAEDELKRETESAGSLDPPSRKPPTDVGLAAEGSDPERRFAIVASHSSPNWFGRILSEALDALDAAADTVADALHIR